MAQWRAGKGIDPPAGSSEPDELFPELQPLWNAFEDLSAGRPIGFGASGGIPRSEMSRYCEDHGIHGAMQQRWCRLLRAMDVIYRSSMAEESRMQRESERRGNP